MSGLRFLQFMLHLCAKLQLSSLTSRAGQRVLLAHLGQCSSHRLVRSPQPSSILGSIYYHSIYNRIYIVWHAYEMPWHM